MPNDIPSQATGCRPFADYSNHGSADSRSDSTFIRGYDRAFTFEKGSGLYQVCFNYTGRNWTHADVAGIRIHTEKPIAVLPMQYTDPSAMQPGAVVDGRHIGKEWKTITQRALARRLEARGFLC